jgi:hypothetical protein
MSTEVDNIKKQIADELVFCKEIALKYVPEECRKTPEVYLYFIDNSELPLHEIFKDDMTYASVVQYIIHSVRYNKQENNYIDYDGLSCISIHGRETSYQYLSEFIEEEYISEKKPLNEQAMEYIEFITLKIFRERKATELKIELKDASSYVFMGDDLDDYYFEQLITLTKQFQKNCTVFSDESLKAFYIQYRNHEFSGKGNTVAKIAKTNIRRVLRNNLFNEAREKYLKKNKEK